MGLEGFSEEAGSVVDSEVLLVFLGRKGRHSAGLSRSSGTNAQGGGSAGGTVRNWGAVGMQLKSWGALRARGPER